MSDYLYDFDKADYISIGNYLSNIDWLTEFGAFTAAADVWNIFCNHNYLRSFNMFHVNISRKTKNVFNVLFIVY